MNLEQLVEYIRITIISLEQDVEGINEEMADLEPDSKRYRDLDVEEVHINGQILGMSHILQMITKEE